MERLTKRNKQGIAYLAIADSLSKKEQEIEGSKPILEGIYASFQKLAAYEDTGLEPEDVKDLYNVRSNPIKFVMDKKEMHKELNNKYGTLLEMYDKIQNELKEYRNLEEQGLLIKLPYKIGDTVYKLENYGEFMGNDVFIPIKCKVKLIIICYYNKLYCDLISTDDLLQIAEEFYEIPINEVFLTIEDAEKALKR